MSISIKLNKDTDLIYFHKRVIDTLDPSKLDQYVKDIDSVIKEFTSLSNKSKSFVTLKPQKMDPTAVLSLFERFIDIAKKYIKIDVIRDTNFCGSCGSNNCGCNKSSGLFGRSKNEYEDEENFNKALMKYQGRSMRRIDFEELTDCLDIFFKSYGLPIGEDIKLMTLNSDGTRGKTNLSAMTEALGHIKKSSYYEDIYQICYEYWGWKLPEISEFHERLLDDYRKTQKIYTIIDKKRKSCLNLQYRIFKHLQLIGCDVKLENFRIPSTTDILREHDELWKQMCEGADLPFIATI